MTRVAAQLPLPGSFTNFETPQTHPIEVVSINGSEVVLVCNTPDDSLEVWTATAPPVFRSRVRVGMGPGTVRWSSIQQRAYVCNFDGDSVSIVQFVGTGASLSARLARTTHVGDEPADFALNPAANIAMVTLSTRGMVQFVDPTTLAPLGGPLRLEVDFADSNGLYPQNSLPMAVKAPRQAAWLANDRMLVLNFMGGQANGNVGFVDVDVWRKDQALVPTSVANYVGGLGTTNHAFALSSTGPNGPMMFIVGTEAQNIGNTGVAVVRAVPTGFTRSWLRVVNVPATGNMTARPEAPAGTPPGVANPFPSINLNRNYATAGPIQEVASDLGVVQPTGVDIFPSVGNVTRIAVTGFHSDNVALLTPNSSVTGGYRINRVSFAATAPYTAVGPRGAEFNAAGTLLFVNGRNDNTLRTVNWTNLASTSVALRDPTPDHIRAGRQFLYSTRFSRGVNSPGPNRSGFTSCASCHVDGRTDGLPWDLSDPIGTPGLLIPDAIDEIGFTAGATFPNPKGVMITQTLQGLVNYPTNEQFQVLATNAPYHWRGDKFTDVSGEAFTKFNEAFVNLQGMPNVGGAQTAGVSGPQMIDYRRFVFSIRHPANPEQPLNRTPTGWMPANPNVADPTVLPLTTPQPPPANSFAGSVAGRALFHNYRLDLTEPKSCVDCHTLPEGSSKTITEGVGQPVESAALRNLFAREGMVHTSTLPSALTSYPLTPMPFPGTAYVSNRGLTHDGGVALVGGPLGFSINNFTANPAVFFLNMPAIAGLSVPGLTPAQLDAARAQSEALIQFVREFDTGMAPLSGFGFTVDNTLIPLNSGLNAAAFDALEAQVRQANIGLGVVSRASNGTVLGFWFDPLLGYRDAATPSNPPVNRSTLLSTFGGPGTVMALQGTPLGVERRWANPATNGVALSGTSPSGLQFEPMAPGTAYEGTTGLNMQLIGGVIGSTRWRMEHFHGAITSNGTVLRFGVPPARRHEPPRRFRVSGQNIRPGARLFLLVPNGTTPPGTGADAAFFPTGMEMPLFPTQFTANGNPVWETELELSPVMTYAMLNGGPLAPGVQATIDTPVGATVPPPVFPTTYNFYRALVVNEDLTSGAIAVSPLSITDVR